MLGDINIAPRSFNGVGGPRVVGDTTGKIARRFPNIRIFIGTWLF
jgi:hypothetical protein